MNRSEERAQLVDAAVAAIRAIEQRDGVNHSSLAKIRARLTELAKRADLFSQADYPPPEAG